MKYRNFGIKTSEGKFYESHKTPVPNAVKFEKDGKTYYHTIFEELSGKLHSVKIDEGEYGTKLKISLTDTSGDAQILSIPLLTDRGGIDDWARSISTYLSQLNVGDHVTLSLNHKERDSKGYLYKNFFVKVGDSSLKFAFSHKDAPKGIKKIEKDKVTKKDKEVWDFSEKDAWYYDIIEKEVNRLKGAPAAPVEAGVTGDSEIPDFNGDDSDLPF